MNIKQGQFTWDVEGCEGGPYHSRKLHVPSKSSGLTIGRGYDMRDKSSALIKVELVYAGLSEAIADKLSLAASLRGDSAKSFIVQQQLTDFEITEQQQVALFELSLIHI